MRVRVIMCMHAFTWERKREQFKIALHHLHRNLDLLFTWSKQSLTFCHQIVRRSAVCQICKHAKGRLAPARKSRQHLPLAAKKQSPKYLFEVLYLKRTEKSKTGNNVCICEAEILFSSYTTDRLLIPILTNMILFFSWFFFFLLHGETSMRFRGGKKVQMEALAFK